MDWNLFRTISGLIIIMFGIILTNFSTFNLLPDVLLFFLIFGYALIIFSMYKLKVTSTIDKAKIKTHDSKRSISKDSSELFTDKLDDIIR